MNRIQGRHRGSNGDDVTTDYVGKHRRPNEPDESHQPSSSLEAAEE